MERRRRKAYEITGGGTVLVNLASTEDTIVLYGTATLTSGFSLDADGTPYNGMGMNVIYVANVSGESVTIFGNTLTTAEASSKMEIRLFYENDTWNVIKKINNDDLSISVSDIGTDSLDGTVIIENTLASSALIITPNTILTGGSSSETEELEVTSNHIVTKGASGIVNAGIGGDVSATLTEITDATTGEVGSTLNLNLNDEVVELTNMANVTRGSIIKGGVSNKPAELDAKTAGRLLAGDGVDIKSLEVEGDVEVTYNSSDDKLEMNVTGVSGVNDFTLNSISSGYVKTYFWQDIQDLGVLNGGSHSMLELNNGDIVVGAWLYVRTVGTGTIDVEAILDPSTTAFVTIINAGDVSSTGTISPNGVCFINNGLAECKSDDAYIKIISSTDLSSIGANLRIDVIEI